MKNMRLEKTRQLDKFMPALKGRCPYHFATEGTLVDAHAGRCPVMPALSGSEQYMKFRKSFEFEPYAYCYSCGIPQERARNGEGPECHSAHKFSGKKGCSFSSFIFKVTFCIWENHRSRQEMRRGLYVRNKLSTLDEFIEWAKEEEEELGKYHNCLEAFLWLCRRVDEADGSKFQ